MKNKTPIGYGQSWEDPALIDKYLNISSHSRICIIASGGCNALYLTSKNPEKLIAIDFNFSQIKLLELKILAITYLSKEAVEILCGMECSKPNLTSAYNQLKAVCSNDQLQFLTTYIDTKLPLTESGKLERYFRTARKYLFPLVHSKLVFKKFMAVKNVEEQTFYYQKKINTLRWRIMFKLFFTGFLINKFARILNHNKSDKQTIPADYFQKTELNFTNCLASENYFLQYILFGYYTKNINPCFLQNPNYPNVKADIEKLELVCAELNIFLNTTLENTFNTYILSDIFDSMFTTESNNIFIRIDKISSVGSKVLYWDHRYKTIPPDIFLQNWKEITHEENPETGRAFFYHRVKVYEKHI